MTAASASATPRRRERAPLSSVDSNVIGSLRKKTKTSTDNTPPFGKQQKQFSTATTKTPGTKKKKKSKKRQKKDLVVNVDTSSVVEFQFKQQQTVGDGDANCIVPPAETLPNHVAAAHDASLSSVSLVEHTPRYTFGSSGIFYDARQWEAQQSKAFQSWLNHLFHPTPEITTVSEEMRAAEMETAMILFNSRRMSAIRFAIDREVTEGRLAITPRAGRNILDEVYVQEQLSTLLLSYTPRWLQLGLHVVLAHHGDQRFHMPNDMSKETLKKIILEQVLSKPSAIQKYTDGKVKTTNIFVEQMLRVEIQQHTLSVLLILVYFLDDAKARHVLTEDPCLFEKTSNVKSSQEMLISLCQDCFAKQRSILNHLEYEGISVSHTQLPLDEYDFRVRNFAVDLKDGVCLAKMVELVTVGSNLLSFLRLPADTRQHKMYNVRLALAALRQIGVPHISDITSAHIVDAHQPRIIQLVWSTVLYLELPEFQEEILQYKASRLIQRQVRRHLAIKSYSMALRGFVSFQSLVRGATVRGRLAAINVAAREIQKIWRGYDSKVWYGFKLMSVITLQSAVRQLLARKRVAKLTKQRYASIQIQKIWRGYERKLQYGFSLMDIISVQSVCRRFVAVRRSTRRRQALGKIQSLARVWKAKKMITRYQDAIVKIQTFMRKSLAAKYVAFLKRQEIEMDTTAKSVPHSLHLSDDEESDGEVFINYSTNQARRRDDKVSLIQHVEQVSECSIINDQSEEVEEEDMISIASYSSYVSDSDLASEIEREVASVVIQMYWRRHVMSTKFITSKKAVIKCQSMCRRCIAKSKAHKLRVVRSRKLAAIKIAAFYRGKATRVKYVKMLAAVKTIQTIARGYFARKEVVDMKCFQIFLTWESSAKKIQAQYRRHLCSTMYKALITGVVSLQAQVRCIHAKKAYNEVLISRAHAATIIQKTFRSFYASSSFSVYKRVVNSAASTIQAAFRRHILIVKYLSMKKAAILIQTKFRAIQAVHSFQLRLRSVHTLQRIGRKFLTELKVKELAATNIQRMWRGYTANVDFMLLVLASIKIQAAARRRSAVMGYQNTLNGIILIQALLRGKSARKLISVQQSSSIILQKIGRGFLSRLQWRKQLDAVTAIQRAARKMIARTREEIEVSAAIEIQRVWRGFSTHVDYMLKVMAAMKIQSRYREFKAKRALLMLSIQHTSSIIIQQAGRGFLARIQKNNALSAAVAIQRAARKMMACKRDNEVRSIAAREIQRIWRGFSVHIDYMLTVMAAIRIQSAVRRFQVKAPLHRNTKLNQGETQLADFSMDRDIIDSFEEIQAHPTPNHYLSPIMKWPESVIEFQAEPSKENTFFPPRVIDVTYTSNYKREVNSTSAIPKTIMIESSDNASHKISVKNLSKYEKHTAKAIKVLRKSHIIHEIIEAMSTLEKTTSKSIDSCKLLLKARAHDNLLSLLGSCNRSSPHVELVRLILHIFTNISRHQSTLSMMVTRESSSSISDVIQMYRDKPDIFALSTSLLEMFVRSDNFILFEYSSLENRKCLHGVLALSQKRASARSRSCPELDKGIACLKNVMHILEHGRPKPAACPYCNREF